MSQSSVFSMNVTTLFWRTYKSDIVFIQFPVDYSLHHKQIYGKIKAQPEVIEILLFGLFRRDFTCLGVINGYITPTKANYNIIAVLLAYAFRPCAYTNSACGSQGRCVR